MPYCADSGAEKSIISARKLKELQELGSLLQTFKLNRVVVCDTVGKHRIIADRSMRMNILLHTAAGPVRLVKSFEVLVIDDDEDEFILGEDILDELGISIDRQLEQLARQSHEDDDPTATADDFWIGSVPDEDVKQAAEDMIAKAIENGFPAENEEQLRTIVYIYDIWRVRLGPDPPAKVPPLELRVKTDATPFRCKPRQYPLHLRKFLKDSTRSSSVWGGTTRTRRHARPCQSRNLEKMSTDKLMTIDLSMV